MSERKKAIVQELGFDGLMHIPPMNVPHKLLKELAYSFNFSKNKLDIRHGALTIKPKKIGASIGLNASGDLFSEKVNFKELSEENKELYRRFQGKALKNLTDEMMNIGVDTDQDCLMFKRIFILYIQMAFLLLTIINKWNWGSHVLYFIIKGISQHQLKKKKFIDGCLYGLMIVYFHEIKHRNKKANAILGLPWVMHWDRELLLQRIKAEINGHMGIVKRV
ncbi:hypothetical protein Ahy_A03g012764 [Arachis hypogaea]|uniref:Uncharacterized protein n=1 Tax=Arachis hypogaea TaxID=3818 RepID=A0A445DUB5_ARAHY|nr:hypothetical protein Ahy_A03g012764 [Arachis hypogaea]